MLVYRLNKENINNKKHNKAPEFYGAFQTGTTNSQ